MTKEGGKKGKDWPYRSQRVCCGLEAGDVTGLLARNLTVSLSMLIAWSRVHCYGSSRTVDHGFVETDAIAAHV